MKYILRFAIEVVKPLVAHTLKSTEHSPTFDQLYDAECRKDKQPFTDKSRTRLLMMPI
jgi:hypothetical protein